MPVFVAYICFLTHKASQTGHIYTYIIHTYTCVYIYAHECISIYIYIYIYIHISCKHTCKATMNACICGVHLLSNTRRISSCAQQFSIRVVPLLELPLPSNRAIMYDCMYVCMYVYVSVNIHIYIYIRKYTYSPVLAHTYV